jgi:hypothetical protein
LAFGLQHVTQFAHDSISRAGCAGTLIFLPGKLAARMKCHLSAPVFNRAAYRGLNECGQIFALVQDGFDCVTKAGFDAKLRQDGGFHAENGASFALQNQAFLLPV